MDFLSQGVIVALFGYFGFILKDIPSKLFSVLVQLNSSTIQFCSEEGEIYSNSMDWVFSVNSSNSLKRHVRYSRNCLAGVVLATGTYYMKLDGLTFAIVDSTILDKASAYSVIYSIKLQIIGKNKNKYLAGYKEYLSDKLPGKENSIIIKSDIGWIWALKRNINDVFTQHTDEIKNILDEWKNKKSFYVQHGITYKLGFLFYGKPGTGKSSMARAIASYLNWNIEYISVKDKKLSYFSLVSDKTVYLIEDIDCLVTDRDNDKNDIMQMLLNVLDGALSPTNCIFVATTNRFDELDKALVRPGRFDYTFEMSYLDIDLAKKMCDAYDCDYSVLEDLPLPISPVSLQNAILKKGGEYGVKSES